MQARALVGLVLVVGIVFSGDLYKVLNAGLASRDAVAQVTG